MLKWGYTHLQSGWFLQTSARTWQAGPTLGSVSWIFGAEADTAISDRSGCRAQSGCSRSWANAHESCGSVDFLNRLKTRGPVKNTFPQPLAVYSNAKFL